MSRRISVMRRHIEFLFNREERGTSHTHEEVMTIVARVAEANFGVLRRLSDYDGPAFDGELQLPPADDDRVGEDVD